MNIVVCRYELYRSIQSAAGNYVPAAASTRRSIVIKLTRPVGAKIDVKVCGLPFASGELVRIGGVLSLRISGFHTKDGA